MAPILFGALAFLFANAPPDVPVTFRLYGAPASVDQALKVTCGKNTYSFKYSRNKLDEAIEFNREPKASSKALSEAMIGVLRKFQGPPNIEAWCASASGNSTGGILSLEILGSLDVDDRDARSDCIKRDGIYDPKSLWIVQIDGDDLTIWSDTIGRCTTKQDIDEFRQRIQGSRK